jgi:hypothetical protein
MGIKAVLITQENINRFEDEELGDLLLETDSGVVASWGPAAFDTAVQERPGSTNGLNLSRSFTFDSGVLHRMLNEAYKAGQTDQKISTQRTLKDIFGL